MGKEERRPYQPIIGGMYSSQPPPETPPSQPSGPSASRRVFQRIIGYQRDDQAYNRQASGPPPPGPGDTAEIPVTGNRPMDAFRRRWEGRRNRRKGARTLPSADWRSEVIPQTGHVNARDLRHGQSLLNESMSGERENVIYYFSRYHWFKGVDRVMPAVGVGFVGLVVLIGSLYYKRSGSYVTTNSQTHTVHSIVPWYVLPLIGLLLVVVAAGAFYFLSYSWRYQFILLTNTKLRLLNAFPPRRSLILQNDIDNNDLNRIESVDLKQTRWGKVFDYGTLLVYMVGIEKPKVMEMVRRPFVVADLLEAARSPHHPKPAETGPFE